MPPWTEDPAPFLVHRNSSSVIVIQKRIWPSTFPSPQPPVTPSQPSSSSTSKNLQEDIKKKWKKLDLNLSSAASFFDPSTGKPVQSLFEWEVGKYKEHNKGGDGSSDTSDFSSDSEDDDDEVQLLDESPKVTNIFSCIECNFRTTKRPSIFRHFRLIHLGLPGSEREQKKLGIFFDKRNLEKLKKFEANLPGFDNTKTTPPILTLQPPAKPSSSSETRYLCTAETCTNVSHRSRRRHLRHVRSHAPSTLFTCKWPNCKFGHEKWGKVYKHIQVVHIHCPPKSYTLSPNAVNPARYLVAVDRKALEDEEEDEILEVEMESPRT